MGKKTARWIEEQNEFLGKQEEKEFEQDRKESDPPVFNPSGPIKVLQKQRANPHTGYERVPQHLMGAQKGQAPQSPLVMTNRGDVGWRGPGKRYPLKEKWRTQWGGYGRQYGTGGERKSNQTYRTDGTQTQSRDTAIESQRQSSYFPTKSTGNGQGGNGGDEDRNDERKCRDTRIGFENDSHEESDTEDSYELEITPQQLSQVTPGGGALKIKLSRKKPLQITAGAPGRKSGTSMEPENIQSSKQSILSSHIDTSSENAQVKKRIGAPLLMTPKHLGSNIEQSKGIPIKGENDLRNSNNHRLARERVTQEWSNESRGNQDPNRMNNPPGNGGGGDSSGGTSRDQKFPGEGRGRPRRNGNQRGGGGDDYPDPSDDGDGDDFSSSTDSSVPKKRKQKGPKYVYVLQGPPGPKGQEGQPGQAGRDGRDGQDLSLTKVLEETLKAHKPNLDTTGLENSFDQFGQTIFEV